MKIISLLLLTLLVGCTTTPKKKSDHYKNIVSGFIVGAILGSVNVPENENPAAHMALWGSTTAALAGAYSISKDDLDEEVERLKKSNNLLRESIADGQEQPQNILDRGKNMLLERPVPEEFRAYVVPGRWEVYEAIIPDGNGSLVKGKQIRIIPPKITPR